LTVTPLEELRIRLWTTRQQLRLVESAIADAEKAAVDPLRRNPVESYLETAESLRRDANGFRERIVGLEAEIALLQSL
jgi:hypothetical protein